MSATQGQGAAGGVTSHGDLLDLLVDDHTIYLLLAGRSGGQSAIGGTDVADQLDLSGSSAADGRVHVLDPFELEHGEDVGGVAEKVAMRWRPTFTTAGAFVGGMISATADITYTNPLFIYALLSEGGTYRAAVAPGFAAFTLFNALPRITNDGNFDLVQALILNASPTHERTTSGTSTVAQAVGLAFTALSRTTVSGAVVTKSIGNAGVVFSPTFSTVAGSTVNLGTQRGLQALNPAVALFQTQDGVETMTAYRAVDVAPIPFGGNVEKSALRSGITPASNARFLDNVGGAQSDFGGGNLLDCRIVQLLADGVPGALSQGAAGGDMLQYWDGSALVLDPLVGDLLRWQPFAANYWRLDSSTTPEGLQIDLEHLSIGSTAADPSLANFFTIFAAPNLREPAVAGDYSDVLWTAGGSIQIPPAFAMGNVQAYKIDSPAILLGAGASISDLSNLFVEAMPSFGASRFQALRVLGRARIDGLVCHNEATLATLTADVAALTLPPNNLGRARILIDADALGPWTIQGIVNDQVGDTFKIVNQGANAFDFGHEDVGAAAADRIITPTAATFTLGAREFAELWYDPAAGRWRILGSNGA